MAAGKARAGEVGQGVSEYRVAAANGPKLSDARREALHSVEQAELDKTKKRVEAENRKRRPGQKRTKLACFP